MLRWAFAAVALLASCAPGAPPPDRQRMPDVVDLPVMKRFDGRGARAVPMPDNAQFLRDFIDLSFKLESGRTLPVFTRFEGAVTVAVEGIAPPTLDADLDDLLVRLRREAGIDISRAEPGRMASITIEALPRASIQGLVPQAACFVVPNVSSWAQYVRMRRSDITDWGTLKKRTRAAVFLPSDVSPQEIRDCLHEEIAQALGPLNDLYRLPFTVFNDDNLHTILTGFDMAVLRATYAPELKTGMTAQEVADALPSVLARVNPAGRRAAEPAVPASTDAWKQAINRALRPTGGSIGRAKAASDAVEIARVSGWNDTRLGYSLLSFGRASLSRSPERAIGAIVEASLVFRSKYGEDVHAAHAIVQPAAFALTAGQPDVTLQLTDWAVPAAQKGQNAALLSTLLLLRAEALVATGRISEGAAIAREGKGWALYGYGSAEEVRSHVAEVAALRPGV